MSAAAPRFSEMTTDPDELRDSDALVLATDEPLASVEERAVHTPRWLELLVRGLDDAIRTREGGFGVGLDPLLGLLAPGAGDALGAFVGASVLFLALRQGVPTTILGKMVLNVLLDAAVGVVPGAGDLFDLFFRSNRRNLELLEEYRDPDHEPSTRDKLLVGGALAIALGLLALPFVLLYLFGSALAQLFGG